MTNEQREAIKYLKESVLIYKNTIPKISQSIETVLSLIKEQQEKIEKLKKDNSNAWQLNAKMSLRHLNDICKLKKKDKQIDLMAKFIENNMSEKKIINEICIKSKCNNEECHEDDLKDCIKQYFANKVNSKIQ